MLDRCSRSCAVAALAAWCASGCAHPGDRWDDLADVVTVGVTEGWGAQVQAGPILTGAGLDRTVAGLECGTAVTEAHQSARFGALVFGVRLSGARPEIEDLRGKYSNSAFALFVPVDFETAHVRPASFWTQFDAGVSLFFGLRVGLNPGELLDLLLGFAGVDLYGDDRSGPEVQARRAAAEEQERIRHLHE